jgi:hypothetical protein
MSARLTVTATDLDEQFRPGRGVLFILGELNPFLTLGSEVAIGMTLSASHLTLRKIVDRRGNGPRMTIENHPNELIDSVELGPDVGLAAFADVALHAAHLGVRSDFVLGELGRHHMARLTAELVRLHVLYGRVR